MPQQQPPDVIAEMVVQDDGEAHHSVEEHEPDGHSEGDHSMDGGDDPDFNPSSSSSSSSPSPAPSEGSGPSSSGTDSDHAESSDDDFIPMQDHPIPGDANDLLYEGAPLTKLQSYLMTHQHMNQFHPSRVEKESLLRLIAAHCPVGNNCFTSLGQYENFLNNGQSYSSIHEYCGRCFHLYLPNQVQCPGCQAPRWLGSESPSFAHFACPANSPLIFLPLNLRRR